MSPLDNLMGGLNLEEPSFVKRGCGNAYVTSTLRPASCSWIAFTICVSVNFDFFIITILKLNICIQLSNGRNSGELTKHKSMWDISI